MNFFSYLKSRKATAAVVRDESLEQHDERYHPEGYKEGDICKVRETKKKTDKVDDIGSSQDNERCITDILAAAPRDAQGRLLAPNGKPTNLTERQYAQVRFSLQGRGNGYAGYSMSNNAITAYEQGEKPISKWSKNDILEEVRKIAPNKVELLKDISLPVLKQQALKHTSWHHSSSWYNMTDFYSIDKDFVKNLTEEKAKKLSDIKTEQNSRVFNGDFYYIEWSGTKSHPRANKKEFKDVLINERGSFYYVYDKNGDLIVKKKIGSNGTFAINNDLLKRNEERMKRDAIRMANNTTPNAKIFLNMNEEGGVDYSKFDTSYSGSVYQKGRKPKPFDYDNGLERFFSIGEKRAVKNELGGYSLETWNGKNWEREDTASKNKKPATDVIALSPTQIKSATDNKGTLSRAVANILDENEKDMKAHKEQKKDMNFYSWKMATDEATDYNIRKQSIPENTIDELLADYENADRICHELDAHENYNATYWYYDQRRAQVREKARLLGYDIIRDYNGKLIARTDTHISRAPTTHEENISVIEKKRL